MVEYHGGGFSGAEIPKRAQGLQQIWQVSIMHELRPGKAGMKSVTFVARQLDGLGLSELLWGRQPTLSHPV